jgi:Fic family protein
MAGTEVLIRWSGRTVTAWVPDPLVERDLLLSEATVRRTEQAAAAARRGSDALPADWEALARLLLRAEGVASSFVEGIRAPLAEVAAAELDPTVGETAVWVADNLAAVLAAIGEGREGPLEVASLHRWHRRLMAGASHLPAHLIGAARDLQGWIGGSSPLDAALVTPPPERLGSLLDDLVAFANRTDIDPVTQAAVAHAQFELIHPYADGNGRVGRMLVGWMLTRRLGLVSPPPISVRIATDRGGYLSGLTLFRLGQADPWVAWFADVVAGAGDAATNLVRAVGELQARWEDRIADVRADAAAHRVLGLLPAHPVLAASTVAAELGISERAGRDALDTLEAHGVVERFRPTTTLGGGAGSSQGRPRRWWVAAELLSLVGAWSR